MNQNTLGIDIAARSFVAALRLSNGAMAEESFTNDAAGFRRLRRWLRQHCVGQVVAGIETTNVYGEKLAHWLHGEGHHVYMLNPAKTAHYAKALGRCNKTDSVDARLIAMFVAGHLDILSRWLPPAQEQVELRALTRLRAYLVGERDRTRNQLRTAQAVAVPHLRAILELLERQLGKVLSSIRQLLRAHPSLLALVRRLSTIKGVGELTAAIVVAELPPIDANTDPRTIAAWAGLVPRRWQSGTTERPARLGKRGNAYLRQALFMPALVARRYNPLFQRFAKVLHEKHKTPGAIAGAISHKMLRIMVGMLKNQQDFDPNWSFS